MIAIFIFYLHIVGAVYAFTQGYFHHTKVDGFMSIAFFGIIFSVGWTIAGFIVRFIMPKSGFTVWLDRDTVSLLIVTILEIVLYTTYFLRKKGAAGNLAVQK